VIRRTCVESRPADLEVTVAQAQALQDLGRRLASERSWWGTDDIEEAEGSERRQSVIACSRLTRTRWRVTVRDAIGVVAVPGLQLTVAPKIPLDHLLYLLERADVLPRLDERPTETAQSSDLWELVARWFVTAAEHVLRRDLMRDYEEHRDRLEVVRGRIDVMETAQAYYAGSLAITCEYEEFTTDMPLNRVLKAAARHVLGSGALSMELRRRASRVVARMEDVGALRREDLRVRPSRTTAHYRDAWMLGRHLLQAQGRRPETGDRRSWGFLLRTPEAVEAGVLAILRDALAVVGHTVDKRGRTLTGSSLTLNPDLVFDGGVATADVKYTVPSSTTWSRGQLYQAVAFAVGFGTDQAAVLGFPRRGGRPVPASISVGDVAVRYLGWPADDGLAPQAAAEAMVGEVRSWLEAEALDLS
jgi:5-methylcytosine-specific restriction enzyme subunit McrC